MHTDSGVKATSTSWKTVVVSFTAPKELTPDVSASVAHLDVQICHNPINHNKTQGAVTFFKHQL